MRARPTEKVIEDLLVATYGYKTSMREQYNFRQALYCLVQLAKAEQVLEIKTNVKKLTGSIMSLESRRKTKSILQRVEATALHGQQQLEFDGADGNKE
jgi:hypothetical protein